MGPFKNLITATFVRYLVVVLCAPLGAFLVAKGILSAEQWASIQFFLESGIPDFLVVLAGGGTFGVAVAAAWTGIQEAGKEKVVLNGIKHPVGPDNRAAVREAVTHSRSGLSD